MSHTPRTTGAALTKCMMSIADTKGVNDHSSVSHLRTISVSDIACSHILSVADAVTPAVIQKCCIRSTVAKRQLCWGRRKDLAVFVRWMPASAMTNLSSRQPFHSLDSPVLVSQPGGRVKMARSKRQSSKKDADNPGFEVSNNLRTPPNNPRTLSKKGTLGGEPQPPGTAHTEDLTMEDGASRDLFNN